MGTEAPTIITIPVRCAPKKAPCPTCGRPGRRKRILPPRRVRTVAYQAIAYLEITCGEYQARCHCCMTFRTTAEGVRPRTQYDNKVRDLVLDRILKDGMNLEQTMASLRRELWSRMIPACIPRCWPNCGPMPSINCVPSISSRTSTSSFWTPYGGCGRARPQPRWRNLQRGLRTAG